MDLLAIASTARVLAPRLTALVVVAIATLAPDIFTQAVIAAADQRAEHITLLLREVLDLAGTQPR
jgi:hypothetical protein